MKAQSPLLAAAVLLALAASTALAADPPKAKKLYCWNEGGQKVCGDALPPEHAARARTEFSAKSGRTLDRVDRALTAEERAAAAVAAKAAQLDADAEAARLRRDLAMVESYATEAELQRAFNERIALVEASIKTSVLSEANLRRGLVGLLGQAANLELAGKPVAKPLQDSILQRHADLSRQADILRRQRRDRASLDSDLSATLQRYRELKAEATGGGAAMIAAVPMP